MAGEQSERVMGKVLVVGKNSFLARQFLSRADAPERCLALGHREALDPLLLGRADCVVNFALDPGLRREPYDPERDYDARLGALVARGRARYVMLSSRAVYAPDAAMKAREDRLGGEPASHYGRNKRLTEERLVDLLGERATLLRIGNVIGNERGLGRRTFMGQALDRLATHKEIVLDIDPRVRRDFLPVGRFVQILEAVSRDPLAGPINVGSGLPLPVGSLAGWLIEGFGEGEIRVVDDRIHDEFFLDLTRLKGRYGFEIGEAEIAGHCRQIGAEVRHALDP